MPAHLRIKVGGAHVDEVVEIALLSVASSRAKQKGRHRIPPLIEGTAARILELGALKIARVDGSL